MIASLQSDTINNILNFLMLVVFPYLGGKGVKTIASRLDAIEGRLDDHDTRLKGIRSAVQDVQDSP